MDANINRCAEALRVLEEHARFVLEDAGLSGLLKNMRHELRRLLSNQTAAKALAARDTVGDTGTRIKATDEYARTRKTMVQANIKRLQEGLRVLEEYAKVARLPMVDRIEALRYQSYTLEKRLAFHNALHQRLAQVRVYIIMTGHMCGSGSALKTTREVIKGGAGMVQMREKDMAAGQLLALGKKLQTICRQNNALFIVNDRPDIAAVLDADGVHVGQDDLPVHAVRRIVGPDKLVGVSTRTIAQARKAQVDGADYIGVGPVRETNTKPGRKAVGIRYVRQAAKEIHIPFFPIGGITRKNLPDILKAGGNRISVCSAIINATSPQKETARFLAMMDGVS